MASMSLGCRTVALTNSVKSTIGRPSGRFASVGFFVADANWQPAVNSRRRTDLREGDSRRGHSVLLSDIDVLNLKMFKTGAMNKVEDGEILNPMQLESAQCRQLH